MKIVGFIERDKDGLIRSILKQAGLWKDFVPRAPPVDHIPCVAELVLSAVEVPVEYVRDAEYFKSIC